MSQFSLEPSRQLMAFLYKVVGALSCGDCCCIKGRTACELSKFLSKAYPCIDSSLDSIEYALEWGARNGLFHRGENSRGLSTYAVNRRCRLKNPRNSRFVDTDEDRRPVGAAKIECCLPPSPCDFLAGSSKRMCPKRKCKSSSSY